MIIGTTVVRRFVLVCYRDDGHKLDVEWTYWPSREQAEQARDQLTPCGPHCIGIHSIASMSREIATATNPPMSGDSAPPRRRPAPSTRNVIRHSTIHREERCAT